MNNGRFAISVHILTLLATSTDEWSSSEYLAGSIRINPAMVRKELVNLRACGFVKTKEGKSGGAALLKRPDQIMMSEIYIAVRSADFLGKSKNQPNPDCPVGSKINHYLNDLYGDVEKNLLKSLEQTTLASFCSKFQ